MSPLIMLHRGDKAVAYAEKWESTITDAIASVKDTRANDVEPDQSLQHDECASTDENSRVDILQEMVSALAYSHSTAFKLICCVLLAIERCEAQVSVGAEDHVGSASAR